MRVLALDVGSSSTRACAFDERGRELGEPSRRAYEARHGQGGSAELDADELVSACEAVLAEAGAGHAATRVGPCPPGGGGLGPRGGGAGGAGRNGCRRRSRTGRGVRPPRRSATGPARTSAPAARRRTGRR